MCLPPKDARVGGTPKPRGKRNNSIRQYGGKEMIDIRHITGLKPVFSSSNLYYVKENR